MGYSLKLQDSDKGKHWAFEVYKENWDDVYHYLLDTYLMFCWIYHDQDTTEDGELKKPHYHVMVCWGNNTTYKNVKKHFAEVASNGYILRVGSGRGYYLYMPHLTRPEKHQYKLEDVHFENGMNEDDVYTELDYDGALQDIDKIIMNLDITDYAQLLAYFYKTGDRFYIRVCHKNVRHLAELLKSVRCTDSYKTSKLIADQEPGEENTDHNSDETVV